MVPSLTGRRRLCAVVTLLAASSLMSTRADPWRDRVAHGAMQVRVGGFFPEGGGDVWDANEEAFTLDSSDFADATFGFSLLYSVQRSLDFGLNLDFYNQSVVSEYADFVDGAGFPILHDTRLRIVPLTFDVRLVPGGRLQDDRGRRRATPRPAFYVGAGAGITYWEYEESGEFLDFGFEPAEIFDARFTDSGATFGVHVLAGMELPVSRSVSFLVEGRHTWADAELDDELAGLGTLELGGTSVFGGLSFRF